MVEQKIPKTDSRLVRGPGLEIIRKKGLRQYMEFEEAYKIAEAEKRVLASNKRIGEALRSEECVNMGFTLPCWTGTIIAYVSYGHNFGDFAQRIPSIGGGYFIVSTEGSKRENAWREWIFPVPEEYLHVSAGVLVSEHPDYVLEIDGKTRVVRTSKIDLVRSFNGNCNRYFLSDPVHGIPCGDPVNHEASFCHLERADYNYESNCRVFPIIRGSLFRDWSGNPLYKNCIFDAAPLREEYRCGHYHGFCAGVVEAPGSGECFIPEDIEQSKDLVQRSIVALNELCSVLYVHDPLRRVRDILESPAKFPDTVGKMRQLQSDLHSDISSSMDLIQRLCSATMQEKLELIRKLLEMLQGDKDGSNRQSVSILTDR